MPPKKHILTILLSAISLGSAALAEQLEPVMTEYGLVRGTSEEGLTVYKGIPFAAPPVGDLRWHPPQPAAKGEGVRNTTTFAADPYQASGRANLSEDCL